MSGGRRSHRGATSGTDSPKISVIVPVFNEAATLTSLLHAVRAQPLDMELIVIDDGSTDGSREQLLELSEAGVIDRLRLQPTNLGKGQAVRDGIRLACGDVVVIQDADGEYDPADLLRLLEPITSGNADAVFGSRFLRGPFHGLLPNRLANMALTRLSNLLTRLELSDMETGSKAIRRDLVCTLPLTARRFGIEPELTGRLAQAGARIVEVPVRYQGRSHADGKKVGWLDGVAALWFIARATLVGPRPPAYRPAGCVSSSRRRSSETDWSTCRMVGHTSSAISRSPRRSS